MVNSSPENNQMMVVSFLTKYYRYFYNHLLYLKYDLMCCFPFQVSHNGIYNFVQRRMDMNRVIHVLVYELFVTICLYTEEEALYILKELG